MDKNELVKAMARLLGQPRFSIQDKSLLKATFGGNDVLILAVRSALLGFDLTPEEKELIRKSLATPEIHKLMRKLFLPELSKDIPITQNYDLWKTDDVFRSTPETFDYLKDMKKHLFDLIETGLERLKNPDGKAPNLTVTFDSPLEFVHARNGYIDSVENKLSKDLIPLSNGAELTPEEMMEKIKRDSSK